MKLLPSLIFLLILQMILLLAVLRDNSSQSERSTTRQQDSGQVDMPNEITYVSCLSVHNFTVCLSHDIVYILLFYAIIIASL